MYKKLFQFLTILGCFCATTEGEAAELCRDSSYPCKCFDVNENHKWQCAHLLPDGLWEFVIPKKKFNTKEKCKAKCLRDENSTKKQNTKKQ